MRRNLEKFFKSKLQQVESPYESGDWEAMEKLLDEENRRPIGAWFWLVPLLALLSLGAFIWSEHQSTYKASAENKMTHNSAEEIDGQPSFKVAKISGSQLQKLRDQLPKRDYINSELLNYWTAEEDFSMYSHNSIAGQSRVNRNQLSENYPIANHELISKIPFHPIANFGFTTNNAKILFDQSNDFIHFTQEKPSKWEFGIGASLSYDWNGQFQLWKSVAYHINDHLSLNVRPGLAFRNEFHNQSIRVVQHKYDFGKHLLEYDLELGSQYSIEIPLLVGFHNGRHSIYGGAGVEWTLGQRATFNMSEMSDMKNRMLDNPVGAVVEHSRKTWVESPRPFTTFAEAGYSYKLNSTLDIGIRTRLYFLNNSAFDELNEEHFNAALQLKWNFIQ